jgi:hypothetical protein
MEQQTFHARGHHLEEVNQGWVRETKIICSFVFFGLDKAAK